MNHLLLLTFNSSLLSCFSLLMLNCFMGSLFRLHLRHLADTLIKVTIGCLAIFSGSIVFFFACFHTLLCHCFHSMINSWFHSPTLVPGSIFSLLPASIVLFSGSIVSSVPGSMVSWSLVHSLIVSWFDSLLPCKIGSYQGNYSMLCMFCCLQLCRTWTLW